MSLLFNPPLPKNQTDKIQWGELYGSAPALAIANAATNYPGTSVLIAPDTHGAENYRREIQLYLQGRANAPTVVHFSDWEILPYDNFSPHHDIVSERMRVLYHLSRGDRCLVVLSSPTLLQRLAPPNFVLGNSLILEVGQSLDPNKLRNQLVTAGYCSVDTVYQHGEFATRGALLDIYPMGSRWAYRIELFDDAIESLRTFDTETQRTVEKVNRVELLPGREYPLDKEAIARFREGWHTAFDVDHRQCPMYQDISSGIPAAGIEYYLSLFFEQTAQFFHYLPERTLIFTLNEIEPSVEHFWQEITQRHTNRQVDPERPILPPHKVFLPVNEVFGALKAFPRISIAETKLLNKAGISNFSCSTPPDLSIDLQAKEPLDKLSAFISDNSKRLLFCAETAGRQETLKEQFKKIDLKPSEFCNIKDFLSSDTALGLCIANISQGLVCDEANIAIIAEAQILGHRVQQKRRRKSYAGDQRENIIKHLTELKIGAPVVHIDHGVGRYRGLQAIAHNHQTEEFVVLEYSDAATLYVPITNLNSISRYTGADADLAPWHKLGSEQWQKAKRKAAEQVRDVAAELLDIYARRKAREGFAFTEANSDYQLFSANFPFEETEDQEAAIVAVRNDMLASQPMDRLICGDVGFGKTEVAMRAAFIAVHNSKQVVILVPTTLLAQQHHDNFKDRFAGWPVNIEVISRFRSKKDIEHIERQLGEGRVDIVIGTHKLLQGGLQFPNLGLLIIDEEHRFGVRQKEALKSLRAQVDILTMTATPIPRTLNMAMTGIRDLSIIATPPSRRLSVKTFVREHDTPLVKEAIAREILRGGQVYYLHNEVKTIDKTAQELATLIPEARVRIGHGQMRERELEAVMSDFYHQRFNILVCSTIIETGIDVPSANTIIIERADRFGLAQLHQLRGRVGRSHHQAYAYLLTPPPKTISSDAHKRLQAIEEAQDLGAGFTLASHDLEIRGAGELLGEEQSGQMQAIGFSLYMDMLDRAVKAIQEGLTPNLDQPIEHSVELNLGIPALIPESYLSDVNLRLIFYKRLASVSNPNELEALQVEMIDRFGLLPDAVKNLIRIGEIRLSAANLGVKKIECSKSKGQIEFCQETRADPLKIVKMVQKQPQIYRLNGANHLTFALDAESPEERMDFIEQLIQALHSA